MIKSFAGFLPILVLWYLLEFFAGCGAGDFCGLTQIIPVSMIDTRESQPVHKESTKSFLLMPLVD